MTEQDARAHARAYELAAIEADGIGQTAMNREVAQKHAAQFYLIASGYLRLANEIGGCDD